MCIRDSVGCVWGSASPDGKLTIAGGVTSRILNFDVRGTSVNNNQFPSIWAQDSSATGTFYNSQHGHLFLEGRAQDDRHIHFLTGASSDMRMIIKGDGKVGIGTTSPFSDLSINVGANAPSSSGNMASEGLTVHNAAGGRAVQIGVNESGAYNYIQSSYVNNSNVAVNLAFFTGASERMRIDSSGNVGIGRVPFSAGGFTSLDVDGTNGSLRVKEFVPS